MIGIMSEEIFAYLLPIATGHRIVGGNEYLFHRGDVVRSVFLLREGSIVLVRHQANGKPAILQRAKSGMVLAEASLFSDSYHCDAVVTKQADLVILPVHKVRDLLATDPGFSMHWSRHLTNELQSARRRAEIVSLHTVSERIDAWLAWHDGLLPPKGQWRGLAEEIGVSPEALYRQLSKRRI